MEGEKKGYKRWRNSLLWIHQIQEDQAQESNLLAQTELSSFLHKKSIPTITMKVAALIVLAIPTIVSGW